MTTPLVYHATRPDVPQVGDCWFALDLIDTERDTPRTAFVSDAFIARWQAGDRSRVPLIVRVPGAGGDPASAFDFCVDGPFFTHGRRLPNTGWSVAIDGPLIDGAQPPITVTPSIDIGGGWHGWITAGVLRTVGVDP